MFDRNDAVFADFADDFGDQSADFGIASGNRSDFSNFFVVAFDFFGGFFDAFNNLSTSFFNSLAKFHGIDAGGNKFVGFVQNVIGKNCDGSGAIAGNFVEFLSSGLDEFGTNSFAEMILVGRKIDGFGNGDAVMSDGRGAVGFFDDDVLAFGAEGDFDGVVELFRAA